MKETIVEKTTDVFDWAIKESEDVQELAWEMCNP